MRCYKCGDSGHKEDSCDGLAARRKTTNTVRETKAVFILRIAGLGRVNIRGDGEQAVAVPPFGVELTADKLRVNHVDDQIVFFGHPTREYSFELLLPNSAQPIPFRWGEYRIVVQNRFVIEERAITAIAEVPTVRPMDVNFFVQCFGSTATSFGIEHHARGVVNRYRAFVRDRAVVVTDVEVAMHIRLWTREEMRRIERERADQAGRDMLDLANEMIDGAVRAVADLNLNRGDE